MKTSANGRKFITSEEGKRNKAYKDSRGIWTIGVGHTSAAGAPTVTPTLSLTDEQIDEVLAKDLSKVENQVNSVVKVPLTQNQFDALVSLVFNIGPTAFNGSTVLRKLNTKDYTGSADAFLMWKKAGSDPDILLGRRKRERALFLS